MSYDRLKASPNFRKTQKEIYTELFQETINREFANSSSIWTIQEEDSFASQTYSDVDVRIGTHLIPNITGKPSGDDYKQILFQDSDHPVGIGYLYQFDSNYWITINSEKTKNLASSSIVKRCNNTLRWIDKDGAVYSEPCSIDYLILQNIDYSGSSALSVIPSGTIEVMCQFNTRTNTIIPNQRFLFGNPDNWTAYRIQGGGVNNFNNAQTSGNTSTGMIRLTMKADYISENDDLTNGIAYEDKQVYTISLNQTSLSGNVSTTIQLYPTVKLNGYTISRNVDWVSSNTAKATVSSTGLVTFIATGTATITCSLDGDSSVYATATATISTSPVNNYQIKISPDTNYILEGDTQTFAVYLYKNDVVQGNTFTFSLNYRSVPSTSYGYSVVNGNSFSIENKEKCLSDYLTVTCTSGEYSKTQDINLKGAW